MNKMLLYSTVLLVFSACQKIDNYDQLDLLTDKEWALTSISENGIEIADSCELDNSILFSKDGKVSNQFGAINCNEEYGFDEWKFAQEYSLIKLKFKIAGKGLNGGVGIERREVLELSENRLLLKENVASQVQGMPKIYTYQYQ
ncbi:hypothetical protein DNU06_12390 [Putridiphycobacter roseus]|uniref:Lipocalin-like domain-containing protein n=1 Tax=Putridiphycobacter roseus TaxID=2219161 RepID=A0A2W1MXU3_9FLAO|nr:hypothetical protein [Putridiphycobacter roseus]PZE16647.1 hypothetical protein DNU06_12390 [Putridiphycobacter roseus]